MATFQKQLPQQQQQQQQRGQQRPKHQVDSRRSSGVGGACSSLTAREAPRAVGRPGKSGGGRAAKPSFLTPTTADVVNSVRSLYSDKLEPFGRILLRRVREHCAIALHRRQQRGGRSATHASEPSLDTLESAPYVDPKALQRICRSCRELQVIPIDGNEITVLLVGEAKDFVDVSSSDDWYPAQMWSDAAAYFAGLRGEETLLPGGRYACARALQERQIPFFEGRSLGEICHIVQLAVSQKKLLGYIDGNIVPYSLSEESVKEQCAAWQQPFCSPSKQPEPLALPVATWQDMRQCISAILRNTCTSESGMVAVSNVKRLFRSRFGLDLSETALGYSRVSELLQDHRLHDICALEVHGAGQFVVHSSIGGCCSEVAPLDNEVAPQLPTHVGTTPWACPATQEHLSTTPVPSHPAAPWAVPGWQPSRASPRSPAASAYADAHRSPPADVRSHPACLSTTPLPPRRGRALETLATTPVAPMAARAAVHAAPQPQRPLAALPGRPEERAESTAPPPGLEAMAPAWAKEAEAAAPQLQRRLGASTAAQESGGAADESQPRLPVALCSLTEVLSSQVQRLLELDEGGQQATLQALRDGSPAAASGACRSRTASLVMPPSSASAGPSPRCVCRQSSCGSTSAGSDKGAWQESCDISAKSSSAAPEISPYSSLSFSAFHESIAEVEASEFPTMFTTAFKSSSVKAAMTLRSGPTSRRHRQSVEA
mmetsp:Transcript_75542/g.211749  ORF Transcript_75542/g.211749 Transcript_75542/m.211749 type:complete len:716 (-) Transcript_75542:95-2242(-)